MKSKTKIAGRRDQRRGSPDSEVLVISPKEFGQTLVRPHLRMGSGLVDINAAITRGLGFLVENGHTLKELKELLQGITETIDEFNEASAGGSVERGGRRLN